ncbi:sensor histidine kinase [Ramlibacter sp.]|uniref:sensor histidine kinase n=1 Tax=Ramlibacter sp. TaxID=1917967 RepID=UPI003D1514B2
MSQENVHAAAPPAGRLRDGWTVAALLAAVTAACFVLDAHVSLTSQAMLFILAVVIAAYRLPLAASVACAAGAATLLNFFFIAPRFTLEVDTRENGIALFTMLTVALVISHLGTALRRETQAARRNERRARELQGLAGELADAGRPEDVRDLAQRSLQRSFPGPCFVALTNADGSWIALPESDVSVRDGLRAAIRESAALGPGTGRWPGLDAWFLPLRSGDVVAGAVCVRNVAARDDEGREHAQALCALVGQALARLRLADSVRAAEERSRWHRTQNTFLAAVSHDFRTPLAAIKGAASSLRTQRDKLPASEQARLAESIAAEADHLSSLTENTLQLARLENSGELRLDWESMEEIVGAVLARVRQRDPARRIQSRVPSGLPLIQADPVLLTQLLENLLDNALKYSTDAIALEVRVVEGAMRVEVHDRGPGIAADAEASVFEAYRRNDRAGRRGAGLGLAVGRAIARAHGGELTVRPREGGGSTFALAIPVAAAQPEARAA